MTRSAGPLVVAARRERFVRVATRRLERAVSAMANLEHCANRALYDFTPADVEYLRTKLSDATSGVFRAFAPPAPKPRKVGLTFPSAGPEETSL